MEKNVAVAAHIVRHMPRPLILCGRFSVVAADHSGHSAKRSRYGYIRLTHLSRELLNLMDEGKIAFSVGVELSYLPPEMQHILKEEMEIFDCKERSRG